MIEKIKNYLREREMILKPRTGFDNEPCFRCQDYDPYLDISSAPDYEYVYENHPCDHRRNYCHTWKPLCKNFKEAGTDFWSSENWRIKNKPEYNFMNGNLWRKVQSSAKVIK